jgi:hypothetical protein
VKFTTPAIFARLMLELNPAPDTVLISYPVGAVIERFETRSVPETVIVCSPDTVPVHVLKLLNDPATEIIGVGITIVAVTGVLLNATQPVVEFLANP